MDGKDKNGKDNREHLIRFLKVAFGFEEQMKQDTLQSLVGRTFSVATKKDKNGYIDFWYADSKDNFERMAKNYKVKDESDKSGNSTPEDNRDIDFNAAVSSDNDLPEFLKEPYIEAAAKENVSTKSK